ncbi:MAG TPA: hypothetical protein VIZ69_07710 [Thermoanaerobaculia bacterium]
MKNKTWFHSLAAAAALLSFACATTTFQSTWKAPDARPLRLNGQKVAAVFVSRNPSVRRRAEDAMAREIGVRGARGVPSYTLLSEDRVRDIDYAKGTFEREGFAGVVVMRVTGTETQYSYEPGYWAGPHYARFWGGYWGWGWGTVWEPGYLTADKIVSVETLVYSLTQDKLVWAGRSKTIDPQRIDDFIGELAQAVTAQMEKDGVFAKS